MKILLLTDSLALPRQDPEICNYEQTWPVLLRNEGFQVHQVSIGGADSNVLLRQVHYQKSFCPDIVIVQVGIVDCAPRFISRREKYLLSKLPFGSRIISTLNKKWVKSMRKLTYVDCKKFQSNIRKMVECFPNSNFFFVEIIGEKNYDSILPGVSKNIERYNSSIADLKGVTTIKYQDDNITMSDHHHLNVRGQRVLFKVLKNSLSEILK